MSENYLIHHGILNQKHGVRNGPPYPLAREVSKAIKQGRQAAIQKTTQTLVNKTANKATGKSKKIDIDAEKLVKEALVTMGTVAVSALVTKGVNSGIDAAGKLGRQATQSAMIKIGEMQLKRSFTKNGYIYI